MVASFGMCVLLAGNMLYMINGVTNPSFPYPYRAFMVRWNAGCLLYNSYLCALLWIHDLQGG